MSGILKLVLINIVLLNRMLDKCFLKFLILNADYKIVYDYIYNLLALNNL